jgi:hypothetical protein
MQLAPEALAGVPLSPGAERDLASVHRALLARHLDREPRALRVLREMSLPLATREGPSSRGTPPPVV